MYGLILNTVEQSIAKKKDIGGELEGGLREWYDGKEKEEVIALDHNVNWTVMQPSAGGHIKWCTRPSVRPSHASDFLETAKPRRRNF